MSHAILKMEIKNDQNKNIQGKTFSLAFHSWMLRFNIIVYLDWIFREIFIVEHECECKTVQPSFSSLGYLQYEPQHYMWIYLDVNWNLFVGK